MIPTINLLFAILFGASIFAFVMFLNRPRRVRLTEVEKLSGSARLERGLRGRLQHQLETARINITVSQFVTVSLALGLVGGGAAYLLSNAPLAAILGFAAGSLAYYAYLSNKASSEMEAYEDALPQVMARLRAGAEVGGTLLAAAEEAAEYGPANCREDWRYIASQLRLGVEEKTVFDQVAAQRGSLLLNTTFEMIILQNARKVGISQSLAAIEESLRERVRVMRRARTMMKGPLRELAVVCAIPFLVVVMLRILAPGFAAAYRSLVGQLLLLAGWGVTLAAFVIGYRSFSQGLREETDFGALAADPRRPEIQEEKPAQTRQAARRETSYGALSDILGQE